MSCHGAPEVKQKNTDQNKKTSTIIQEITLEGQLYRIKALNLVTISRTK
jgi:hypothetical protein